MFWRERWGTDGHCELAGDGIALSVAAGNNQSATHTVRLWVAGRHESQLNGQGIMKYCI